MAKGKWLSHIERRFPDNEFIVSKTDKAGKITYGNRLFIEISGYTEQEIIGQQHNLIRHPEMPRAIFKILWDTIQAGDELFAYIVNRAKNGDHYWVFAHVTPGFDGTGAVIGYHSCRRTARSEAVAAIKPFYARLLQEECRHQSPKEGLEASVAMLHELVRERGFDGFDRFVFSL